MHSNDNMAFAARSKGSSTSRTLVVIGGLLLISQVVILLTFNIEAYQSLPSLNPQSLQASKFFGVETVLVLLMIASSVVTYKHSSFRSIIAYIPLISISAIILLNEYMTIPSMGGSPTQVVIQVLSIFVIPADNFVMGGGIILALAGSVMTIVRFTKSNR